VTVFARPGAPIRDASPLKADAGSTSHFASTSARTLHFV
jgi:hypothetical protein